MAKKKLSPTLKAWNVCRVRLGVRPFQKPTAEERRALRDCVAEQTGKRPNGAKRAGRGKKARGG